MGGPIVRSTVLLLLVTATVMVQGSSLSSSSSSSSSKSSSLGDGHITSEDWSSEEYSKDDHNYLDLWETLVTETYNFSCMLGAMNEDECSKAKSSIGAKEACVWCSTDSYGVCMTSDQKELMENDFPAIPMDCGGLVKVKA
eukprot:scaffold96513_cov50-Attheya_sp.AAC.3